MRKRPVRTAEIELPAPYEGWTATVLTSMPMALYDALESGTFQERLEALTKVVLEWNYVDDAGAPVPIEAAAIRAKLGFAELRLTLQAIDQAVEDFLAAVSTPELSST